MDTATFHVLFHDVMSKPINNDWFEMLYKGVLASDTAQRDRLRSALGWGVDTCVESVDAFSANIGRRIRPHMRDECTALAYVQATIESCDDDYRDMLVATPMSWFAMVLSALNADKIFLEATFRHQSNSARVLADFIKSRPPCGWEWHEWGLDIYRTDRGIVEIESTGL
jgi:hypothetical protein